MQRQRERLFSTGEFAQKFHIKKDTLLYYDRIKLFCPAIVKANGYRYYQSSQIEKLWTILSLREIGVPIKALQAYFASPSVEGLNIMANNQLKNVAAEIAKLQAVQHLLLQIAQASQEARQARLEQLLIQPLPEAWFIYSEENIANIDTSNEQWLNLWQEFVYARGLTRAACVGSLIAREDIEKQNFGRVAGLFAASPDKTGVKRPGGLFAIFYHKGSYESIPAVYPQILAGIKAQGFRLAGDAYEEYLAGEIAANDPDEYITKIILPIE